MLLGKGIGLLEDHAHPAPEHDHVMGVVVQVLPVHGQGSFDPGTGYKVVHAVDATQKSGLAATRRPDQGGCLMLQHIEADILERVKVRIVEVEISR